MPKPIQWPQQRRSQKVPKHHQNKTQKTPTRRKPLPARPSRRLSPTNKPGRQEAIKKSTPPKPNTGTELKTKRTTSVSIEEFKPTVVLTTERDIKDGQQVSCRKKKPQMRAERSSSNTSRRPLLLSKLKTLLKLREPLKSPKWTLKTLRILSVRKLESLPEELP